MFKISLLNLPFASLNLPSIALTQLKAVVQKEFADRVAVEICYLNHDFGKYLDFHYYEPFSDLGPQNGLADWFFRQVAFPDAPDNTDAYFERYFPFRSEGNEKVKRYILEKRRQLGPFLDALIDKYRLDEADLVGFTSMFSQNVASFALAKRLKERAPRIVTAMGGANCEWPMGAEVVKNVDQIDYVFSGPALKSFPRLVGHCLDQEMEKCDEIKGVLTKNNYRKPPAIIGEELPLDAEVELDYDLFLSDLETNFPDKEVKPILLFETSRGCWWGMKAHCTFCGLNGQTMNYRAMAPEKAVRHIQSLFKYYPQVTIFECVDNIMPEHYLTEVFTAIKPPPDVKIMYEVKANLTVEDLKVLAGARVTSIQPGIEALATSTLKLMKKGTSAFQNISLLKNCLLSDIYPAWNLLVGFPGETSEVFEKYLHDIPLLTHLPAPAGVHQVRFDRYSPYYVRADEYGLDLRPKDYYGLIYPFDEMSLSNLAYFFNDHNYQSTYLMEVTEWIDRLREKVRYWVTRWKKENSARHPKLHFNRGERAHLVYDSRSEEVVEHDIGITGRRILEQLTRPKRIKDLAEYFKDEPGFNAEDGIASLQERGLIFQENGRFISLVMPGDIPKMDYY